MATYEEKQHELDQKIRRLRAEKRKLEKQQKASERKQRDHMLIVIGATLLSHYPVETREKLLTLTDDEIKSWVNSSI